MPEEGFVKAPSAIKEGDKVLDLNWVDGQPDMTAEEFVSSGMMEDLALIRAEGMFANQSDVNPQGGKGMDWYVHQDLYNLIGNPLKSDDTPFQQWLEDNGLGQQFSDLMVDIKVDIENKKPELSRKSYRTNPYER